MSGLTAEEKLKIDKKLGDKKDGQADNKVQNKIKMRVLTDAHGLQQFEQSPK